MKDNSYSFFSNTSKFSPIITKGSLASQNLKNIVGPTTYNTRIKTICMKHVFINFKLY